MSSPPPPHSTTLQSPKKSGGRAAELNRLNPEDRPVHDWYRFVLSYPPHLVRDYLQRFGMGDQHTVLDPFCGTGTTTVECKKQGVPSLGIEAHPLSCFAARTKAQWDICPDALASWADRIAERAQDRLDLDGVVDDPQRSLILEGSESLRGLPEEAAKLLLANSISPRPLHKVLVLLDAIRHDSPAEVRAALLLALARELPLSIGNLHFGPEVGVAPPKEDARVIEPWRTRVRQMAEDLRAVRGRTGVPCTVHHADSRQAIRALAPLSIDAVITSPPYPNEKDYTRTTRLESVLLGFITTKADLRLLKQGMLMRSNTRNVYKGDEDDRWVAAHPEVQRIAAAIEARRIELGKTSGFERLYAKVTKLYFGGMTRHLAELRPALRPGARLAYVVGDQASYLRVMIRTGQLLASLAEGLGYEVEGIDLFRTRLSTATREQLREEVVILKWPGHSPAHSPADSRP